MPSKPSNDPLFKRHPITGEVHTSQGPLPTPYHVYDGSILLIGGTAELGTVNDLLKGEHVTPIRDSEGRALMAVWVCDFDQASLGSHQELQISILVLDRPTRPVEAHPLALQRELLLQRGVAMLCHGLWNDTNPVVAYNREVLGLNVRLAEGIIGRDAGSAITTFSFKLAANGRRLATGKAAASAGQDDEARRMLQEAVGLRGLWELIRHHEQRVRVINPAGKAVPENRIAETYTRSERQTLRLFDPNRDSIAIEDDAYRQLGFWPQFVQHMTGVRFVYLNPKPWKK